MLSPVQTWHELSDTEASRKNLFDKGNPAASSKLQSSEDFLSQQDGFSLDSCT